jgi:hypothetical protein
MMQRAQKLVELNQSRFSLVSRMIFQSYYRILKSPIPWYNSDVAASMQKSRKEYQNKTAKSQFIKCIVDKALCSPKIVK